MQVHAIHISLKNLCHSVLSIDKNIIIETSERRGKSLYKQEFTKYKIAFLKNDWKSKFKIWEVENKLKVILTEN